MCHKAKIDAKVRATKLTQNVVLFSGFSNTVQSFVICPMHQVKRHDDQFMSINCYFSDKKSPVSLNHRTHQQIHTNLLMKGHCHFKLINQSAAESLDVASSKHVVCYDQPDGVGAMRR